MKKTIIFTLPLFAAALLFAGCNDGSSPISDPTPRGEWYRSVSLSGGREAHSMISLQQDSAFIADTIVSFPGGVATVDSTHTIQLELTVAGDGYYRAVEGHTSSGSDVVEQKLRYWYFFTEGDSLYFYRGMRFRGRNVGLKGNWNLSVADSAFLGESHSYSFDDDKVTVTSFTSTGMKSDTWSYQIIKDTLAISGTPDPFYGTRFEVVPGLALYLTSHRESGYAKKKS